MGFGPFDGARRRLGAGKPLPDLGGERLDDGEGRIVGERAGGKAGGGVGGRRLVRARRAGANDERHQDRAERPSHICPLPAGAPVLYREAPEPIILSECT